MAGGPSEIADTVSPDRLAGPVADALAQQEEFEEDYRFHLCTIGGTALMERSYFAVKLLYKAREAGSARVAVQWLQKLLKTRQASGFCIMTLKGLDCEARVELTENMELCPLRNLPHSKHTEAAIQKPHPNEISLLMSHGPGALESPTAGLIRKVMVNPAVWDLRDGEIPSGYLDLDIYNELDRTRELLTTIGPCCPVSHKMWFQFEDADLQYADSGIGFRTLWNEITSFPVKPRGPFDGQLAQDIVRGFWQLDSELRTRVLIAAERLNQAMRRWSAGDRAVDLSIALETLLSDGGGANTHKVGLRGALLFGGDHTHRILNRAILEAIYSLRSALMHRGQKPDTVKVKTIPEKRNSADVSQEGVDICAGIIRKVITRGGLPDWHEFDLSGGA